jgi:hypothetical protein
MPLIVWFKLLTLNEGLHPTGFMREAWNAQKLSSAYATNTKLEIRGAIVFRSAVNSYTVLKLGFVHFIFTCLIKAVLENLPIKIKIREMQNPNVYPQYGSFALP